jgi:IS4 transposase
VRWIAAPGCAAIRPCAPPGKHAPRLYPEQLRRIKYHDAVTGKTFVFLTNNFVLPALTIAELYRYRWRVELFLKWIKQHLRIKTFFGTSPNAVKTQVWIAVSTYLVVAIIKKRLRLPASLYTLMQLLSLTLFERTSLNQLLTNAREADYRNTHTDADNQLTLFD